LFASERYESVSLNVTGVRSFLSNYSYLSYLIILPIS